MNERFRKYGLLIVAFVICAILNYNPQMLFETSYRNWGWNFSLIATVLILIIFRLRDPSDWKQKLGINFNPVDWLGFFITTIVLLVISYFLVEYLATVSGYAFNPKLFYYKDYFPRDYPFFPILGDYLYYVPETFNEEILIGALLLMGLERHFKRLNKNIIAIVIALIFSLMHQALYKWSPAQPGILLTPNTILALFFVGILRNVLILKTRKIAYSWAIHLSFNIIFFSGFYINSITDQFASEPETFNLIFGNRIMVLITGMLALMALIWLNKKRLVSNIQKTTGYTLRQTP